MDSRLYEAAMMAKEAAEAPLSKVASDKEIDRSSMSSRTGIIPGVAGAIGGARFLKSPAGQMAILTGALHMGHMPPNIGPRGRAAVGALAGGIVGSAAGKAVGALAGGGSDDARDVALRTGLAGGALGALVEPAHLEAAHRATKVFLKKNPEVAPLLEGNMPPSVAQVLRDRDARKTLLKHVGKKSLIGAGAAVAAGVGGKYIAEGYNALRNKTASFDPFTEEQNKSMLSYSPIVGAGIGAGRAGLKGKDFFHGGAHGAAIGLGVAAGTSLINDLWSQRQRRKMMEEMAAQRQYQQGQ